MRIVVAPGAFHGAVTATRAARALESGWRTVRSRDSLTLRPMADGGAGTLASVVSAHPGATVRTVRGCTGPDGQPAVGRYALLADRTAVVELATAGGLPLPARPAPLTASTRGTGETIAAALDAGATRLVLALGDSAATDGGTGLLSALGLRLLDREGHPLPDGGGALARAHRVDITRMRSAPPGGVRLLTDAAGPLLGPEGAAAAQAPGKGADAEQVERLEQGLTRLSELFGDRPDRPGAGAAGGTAYGLSAAWGATVTPGTAAVADLLRLDRVLTHADLVITGEAPGSHGRAVGEVAARAERAGVPVRVVSGGFRPPGGWAAGARDPERWLHEAGAALARTA
ncbi:glycerate kinase [Kitasatospora sp. NPDC006697]|uniref:glycerate kinase n=1 Tax=Kitasatospora sp. NPDC006697 TaxID=3364020 RepID=UPI00368D0256